MRSGTIPPNWVDLVKRSTQDATPENYDASATWFSPDLEEDPSDPEIIQV